MARGHYQHRTVFHEWFDLGVFEVTAFNQCELNMARDKSPATSPQIKAMEEECSGLLFDRSESRITLTAGGQALPPYVEKLKIISQEPLVAVPSALGKNVGQLAEIATLSLG
jgi:hypothetical protein